MSEKRRGLGRGLGALIPSGAAPMTKPAGDRPVDVFFPDRDGEEPEFVGTMMGGAHPAAPAGLAVVPTLGGTTAASPTALPVLPGSPVGRPLDDRPGTSPISPQPPQDQAPGARLVPSPQIPAPTAPAMPVSAPVEPVSAPVEPVARTVPSGPFHLLGAVDREPEPTAPPTAQRPADEDGVRTADALDPESLEGSDDLVPVPGAYFAELAVSQIRPNPRQPRQVFDEESLAELVQSVKEIGVLQPVVVRPLPDDQTEDEARYELVMGERRLRACREAGLERIPAIVRETQDDALLRDALLENLHRAQLNPLEEAAAYQQLLDDFGCTHEDLAAKIGRSRPQISNTLRLLKLPPLVQRRVAASVLSAGHARALLGLEDAAAMERLAQRIVAEGLSVRAVEEIVALGDGITAKPAKRRPRAGSHTSELDDLAARLGDRLDTKVAIALGRNKGRVSIEFASVEDLNRILGLLSPEVRGAFRES